MSNAFDTDLLTDALAMLINVEHMHKEHMFDALKNSSESEALREVRTTAYQRKVRQVVEAVLALADEQVKVVEADKALEARRTKEVNDLLNPSHN